MPGLSHAVAWALGGDGEPVDLAGETDGEVADVDHLLNLTEPFGDDLACLHRHDGPERLLGGSQFLAEEPHEFAAARSGNIAPGFECSPGAGDDLRDLGRRRLTQPPNLGAVDRRPNREGPV